MRIIKEGKDPKEVEVEKTCKTCNTIFAYVRADIQNDFREGNYVICPKCKGFIAV